MRGAETDWKPSACSVSGTWAKAHAPQQSVRKNARMGILSLVFTAFCFQDDRRPLKPKLFADLVHQVTLREEKYSGARSVNTMKVGGRNGLRDIVDLPILEMQRFQNRFNSPVVMRLEADS